MNMEKFGEIFASSNLRRFKMDKKGASFESVMEIVLWIVLIILALGGIVYLLRNWGVI